MSLFTDEIPTQGVNTQHVGFTLNIVTNIRIEFE